MSAHEILLGSLVGQKVRDAAGRHVGRLVEIEMRIDLTPNGSDYVVDAYQVSHFGIFDALARWRLVQQLVERLGSRVGYECRRIPADQLDLVTLRVH